METMGVKQNRYNHIEGIGIEIFNDNVDANQKQQTSNNEQRTSKESKRNEGLMGISAPADRFYREVHACLRSRRNTSCLFVYVYYYPGSLAWDVDNISLVRRVFLI